jgi:glycosyltransferase involved in cell wall biosynthesis
LYKAEQMRLTVKALQENRIPADSLVWVHDVFYPGLEHLKYAAELTGKRLRIAAFNFAGRADPTDFVQKLSPWASYSEYGWHSCCDVVMVGSKFHKKQVDSFLGRFLNADVIRTPPDVVVTGYPLDPDWTRLQAAETGPSESYADSWYPDIAWPHRLAPEKGLDLFLEVAEQARDRGISCGILSGTELPNAIARELRDKSVRVYDRLSKPEYLHILSKSKVFLATGRQETFGYALHEAQALGVPTVCPKEACYSEFVSSEGLYSLKGSTASVATNIVGRCEKLVKFLEVRKTCSYRRANTLGDPERIVKFLRRWEPGADF